MYEAKHIPWEISDRRREEYSQSSRRSNLARKEAELRASQNPEATLTIAYDPSRQMPKLAQNGIRSLSLFSGGGGLDLGFDLAGFSHVASYDLLEFAGATLTANRPGWKVYSGDNGNVQTASWIDYRDKVDLMHGGPPCQPFSIAGRREGMGDQRDMFPAFLRAVDEVRPKVFLVENVLGFLSKKFEMYRRSMFSEIMKSYNLSIFTLSAKDLGVPQDRRRAFVVGVHKEFHKKFDPSLIAESPSKVGVREALGLPRLECDGPAPTLRCTLTGPRQTTSIANSTASVERWTELGVWPHGVSPNRTLAASFPTRNQTYRLCVEECQVLQGFPLSWEFKGAVYQRLGLIGNSVCPPVAYAIASSIVNQVFSAE